MSEAWIAAWNHTATFWAAAMARACWQGSAALALAWIAIRVFPRLPPAVRCWLWRLAFLKLLAALVWARPVDLPLWHLPAAKQWLSEAALPARPPLPGGDPAPAAVRSAALPISPAGVLALLWLLGVGAYAVRFAGQCRQTRRRQAEYGPLSDAALVRECAVLCERLGLRRAPRLLVAAGSGSPWLVGIRSPAIIFPASLLARCGESELRLMLAHELAHVRQRDLPWGWLGTATQGLFFFHPLVWLAGGEWRLAQEMACDAIAMAITRAPAAEYGGVLLKVAAQRPPDFRGGAVTVGVIESYHTLKRRLVAMKSFGTLSPQRLGSAGVALAALAVLVLIPWRVVAEEPGSARVKIVLAGLAGGGGLVELALRPEVQEHLKLNPQQRSALAAMQSQMKAFAEEERTLMEQGLSEEELKARLAERRARMELAQQERIRRLQTTLTPAQLQRLRELSLQWRGPLALTEPPVADAVGLSPAHREEIARTMAGLKERRSEPLRVFARAEGAPEKIEAEQKALLEQHIAEERARLSEAAGRILSLLDAAERARWNALQGAPFAFSREGEINVNGVSYRVLIPASPERP